MVAASWVFVACLRAQNRASEKVAPPIQNIVFGFVGGFVNQDNPVHAEVQLAVKLRQQYRSGLDVEVFEDRHILEAHKRLLSVLAGGDQANPSPEQKRNAHVVLYGHSWGGSAAVELARDLERDGIPVLLTIQVDSIAKVGESDTVIPANVARAVNFYQPHGILSGVREIRAADPSKTQIIGNYRFDYSKSALRCSRYPWWDRYLVKAHTQIECDPVVWDKVEAYIQEALPPPRAAAK